MVHTSESRHAAHEPISGRVHKACAAIGEFVEYWGFKSLHGRVWALLAMHRHPVTQARLARELEVSRASVSAAIAELTRFRLVRPVGPTRCAPYVAVMDVWPTIAEVLRGREWVLMEVAREALRAALDEVEAGAPEQAAPYSDERIRALLGMTTLAQSLLRVLLTVPGPGPDTLLQLRRRGRQAVAFMHDVRQRLRHIHD